MRTLVWYRGKDLRVADHTPLRDAAARGEVVPLFVLDPYFFAPERARELPHRMQFLLESLAALAANLEHLGSRLIIVPGRAVDLVPRLARALRADRVVAQRWCEPFARERDRRIADACKLELYEGETLAPPGSLRTGAGTPYGVFTPFSRAFYANISPAPPLPAPRKLPPVPPDVLAALGRGDVPRATAPPTLADLGISRNPALQPGGERAAGERLKAFLAGPAARYPELRDRMDLPGTSRLSADLKFGTLSIRTVWHAAADALDGDARTRYLGELLWREFAHHTLWDRPTLLEQPFRPDFVGFPWRDDATLWAAWASGHTGYPVIDAAARQLLAEGFVHNRARMITASFLTKHLLISFRRGEAHYLKWLTDGDWAQNDAGWQWSAGCGCDAQPYFRVFNPVTQGERFDPDGAYVRRWVPELTRVPTRWLHAPWTAPALELAAAGIRLGKAGSYPAPIVDHATARARFLALAKSHLGAARR